MADDARIGLGRVLFLLSGLIAFLAVISTGIEDDGLFVAIFAGVVFAFGSAGRPEINVASPQVSFAVMFAVLLTVDVFSGLENYLLLAGFVTSVFSLVNSFRFGRNA